MSVGPLALPASVGEPPSVAPPSRFDASLPPPSRAVPASACKPPSKDAPASPAVEVPVLQPTMINKAPAAANQRTSLLMVHLPFERDGSSFSQPSANCFVTTD